MFYIDIKQTTDMGRGVFAATEFNPGDVIEICPVIPLTPQEASLLKSSRLENWFFEWHDYNETAIILGAGMIYNHSFTPNAVYEFNFENENVIFRCLKKIEKGEQIFIDYNQYKPTGNGVVPMYDPHTFQDVLYVDGKLQIKLGH
jgi:SET domain-containing protein